MKANFSVLLIVITSLFMVKCQREVNPDNSAIRVTSSNEDQNCIFIYPSSDNGIIVLSLSREGGSKKLSITKFNEEGNSEWTNNLPNEADFFSISPSKDGGILMVANSLAPKLIKLDKNGSVVFNKVIANPPQNSFTNPIEGENNHIYFTINKVAPWWADTTALLDFDEKGERITNNTIKLYDNNFLPKGGRAGFIHTNMLFKAEKNQTFYFWGAKYPGFTSQDLFQNPNLYVARFEYDNNKLIDKKTVILDPDNIYSNNGGGIFNHVFTPDNNLLICSQQVEPNDNYKGHLVMVDMNFEVIWKKDISFGFGNTFIHSLRNCPDGNFIICGDCRVSGKGDNQPFAAKISKTGEILWHKIYTTSLYGRFTHGVQTNNGTIFLGGNSTAFGRGLNSQDFFLLRTDKDGILK